MLLKPIKLGLPSLSAVVFVGWQASFVGHPVLAVGCLAASLTPEGATLPRYDNQRCLRTLPNVPWGPSPPPSLLRDTGL